MKKLSLLISLLAFIFIASVSTSYGQSTTDSKKDDAPKTTITTSKTAPADKAPCPKTVNKTSDCAKTSPAKRCCSAKAAPCPKTSAVKKDAAREEEAIIEEKDKRE